ncbi:MAG TPA: hypothetical protein VFE58_20050 [Tepidisphaeraceae bacterium]|jgi:hypothetical protein|nr:hypothetical protein [Tepidisphaeraceae bacterium]
MTQTLALWILAEQGIGSVILWSLFLAVLIVFGYLAVNWVKKWLKETEMGPAGGFTLGDLRELHRNGQMTDVEFERAKLMIVDAAKKAASRQAPPKQPPPGPPGVMR